MVSGQYPTHQWAGAYLSTLGDSGQDHLGLTPPGYRLPPPRGLGGNEAGRVHMILRLTPPGYRLAPLGTWG